MGLNRWIGGTAPVAMVESAAFGGTWITSETITVTVGSKSKVFPVSSAVIATLLTNLATALEALSATDYPEFGEIAWTADATHLLATANTLGKPIDFSISTNSGSGTIGSVTETTANTGPNVWGAPQNWSLGAVPINGDAVVIDDPTWDILYDLDQSAVTLISLSIAARFDGKIGLRVLNNDGTTYPEYREMYLKIGVTPGIVDIGDGIGNGSDRIKIDAGSVQLAAFISRSGSSEEDFQAIMLKGSDASNVVSVTGNAEVGIATVPGETADVSGGLTVSGGGSVVCGAGVTLATGMVRNSTLSIYCAVVTSLVVDGGQVTIYGTGGVAQLNEMNGAYVSYQTSGTLGGDTELDGGSVLDFGQDQQTKTVTNPLKARGGSTVLDPLKVVTGGSGLIVTSADGTAAVQWGSGPWTLTRT